MSLCGACGRIRVRRVRLDPAAQLQELRRAVLVGGHGRAEGEEAQILQQVVQFVESGIARCPQRIAPGEQVGREGAQAEQIIAAVHHHVNRQIVAREHFEIGAHVVAQLQAAAIPALRLSDECFAPMHCGTPSKPS